MKLFQKKSKAGAESADSAATGPDTVDQPPAGGTEPTKKKGLPLMVIAVAAGAILVLGGGGAGAYFMFLAPQHGGADQTHAKPRKKKGGDGGEAGKKADPNQGQVREGPDGVTFYTMPDLVVNIQSPDGKPTFLKLKLTFEMHDAAVADELQDNAPRMQDMFTSFLRELRPEDLSGSEGSFQLRQEILRRVNLILAPQKIDAVDIEEMLVQ